VPGFFLFFFSPSAQEVPLSFLPRVRGSDENGLPSLSPLLPSSRKDVRLFPFMREGAARRRSFFFLSFGPGSL